jgi:CheY-like chemotaxis protein
MHLYALIASHRDELLRRTRAELEGCPADELDHWLPVLLDLLTEALEREANGPHGPGPAASLPRSLGRPAGPGDASPERQMRRLGITLDRVSHDCLELQRAVSELALEEQSSLSASQCHALDRSVARVVAAASAGWEKLREQVVVVETDRHVRRLVETFVADTYRVEFYDDGSSALERVRSEAPALLVTEILVPRLDGLALCRLLKTDRATAHVPVLVYSVLSAEHRARQSGADAFLEKPLEKKRLVASVRELIARNPDPQPQDVAAE